MRKIFSIVFLTMCFSCQNDMKEIGSFENASPIALTRQGEYSFSMCENALLSSGNTVKLPWSDSSKGTIPDEIRVDVAEADGWRVLYSTVKILGCNVDVTDADVGTNYLLLYNLYTGIL